MKAKFKNFYDLIYYSFILLAIGLSIVYGQFLIANIGQFKDFAITSSEVPLYLIILIPILITLLYSYPIYLSYKNGVNKCDNKNLINILILVVLLIYMVILILVKDNSHLYAYYYEGPSVPSLNDRIFSCFAFYLGLLNIYAYYNLFKRTKNSKLFFEILLGVIALYAFIAIIYSLIVEFDKYITFIKDFNLSNKDENNVIKSFYSIGNVFGHTIYFGIVALTLLGIMIKKYYLFFIGLIFTPFILFSFSRASMLGIAFFYATIIIYFIYLLYKKNKIAGITVFSLYAFIVFFVIIDTFFTHLITFNMGGKTYNIYQCWELIFKNLNEQRIWIIQATLGNGTPIDYIFGFGFGLQFVVARTYGFVYYMHNTFVEYFVTGGVIYCIFILILLGNSIYKTIYIAKKHFGVFFLLLSLGISQLFYGLFESIPAFENSLFGAVMALFFAIIPEQFYQEDKEEIYTIETLSFIPFKKVQTLNN